MKAEDTVMNDQQLVDTMRPEPDEITFKDIKLVAQAQAEISLKAGINQEIRRCNKDSRRIYRAGIREVVEWVEGHDKSTCMDCTCAFAFRNDEWQSQKEEWGRK